ncbi:MAG: helix-turn-helix transcriptional regulator [Clostridia bacterium]|nr:helix-turn-helix transcriptional regulator [Clostridia bacterium]
MKHEEHLSFEEEDFPIIIDTCRTSGVDNVEDARRALHKAIEIKYFYEGTSTLLIGTSTVVARAGDVIVINPYEFHATVDLGEERGKYHLFMVEPEFFAGMGAEMPDLRSLLLAEGASFRTQFCNDDRMRRILLRAVEEMKTRAPHYRIAVRGLMLELFALLLRYGMNDMGDHANREHVVRYYAVVEPALRRIRDGYAERCTVGELSELCMVSKYHFCRVFKEVTGMSTMQYLNEYRLKIAETMLENTDKSIAEIACACGFEDESYFCRCYKKKLGTSPGKQRTR